MSTVYVHFISIGKWKWKSLSHAQLCNPLTVQSMEFSRPEYWSGSPFPSPGDPPNLGIKPRSPTLQADSLSSEPPGKPQMPWSAQTLDKLIVTEDRPTVLRCDLSLKYLHYFVAMFHSLWDLSTPTRDWTSGSQQWKYRVLIIGLLGNSLKYLHFLTILLYFSMTLHTSVELLI